MYAEVSDRLDNKKAHRKKRAQKSTWSVPSDGPRGVDVTQGRSREGRVVYSLSKCEVCAETGLFTRLQSHGLRHGCFSFTGLAPTQAKGGVSREEGIVRHELTMH